MTNLFSIADKQHIHIHTVGFEFTCDVKSFLDKNSNRSFLSLFPPLSCLLCHFHFTMTKTPRRPRWLPYLPPPPLISTQKTTASFRPPLGPSSAESAPSEQPTISDHHHCAFQPPRVRINEFARWHRCCCQPDSSFSHPNLPHTLRMS